MKLTASLITRRTFLNTLFGGWFLVFFSGSLYALWKFAFPTLGKEPDFVVLKTTDFLSIPPNSVKPFAWGGKAGLIFKKTGGTISALKGVCTHMECNITYRPEERKFYCACHKGWFDENGKNIEGPPPKPLEFFDITTSGEKLIIAKKGVMVDLSKI
jgi:cytochrome b6-f complex iron-sulfur subunit